MSRVDLQYLLESIIESKNVYFQPPESLKIKYPAIVYGLEDIDNTFADNSVYISKRKYILTLIDYDPDNIYIDILAGLPTSTYVRHYSNDNLSHDVFTIFY